MSYCYFTMSLHSSVQGYVLNVNSVTILYDVFYIHVNMHGNKFLFNNTNQMH
jgi:hypothetical protein